MPFHWFLIKNSVVSLLYCNAWQHFILNSGGNKLRNLNKKTYENKFHGGCVLSKAS